MVPELDSPQTRMLSKEKNLGVGFETKAPAAYRCLGQSVLHGSCLWVPDGCLAAALTTQEGKWLRAAWGCRRAEGEDFVEWWAEQNSLIRRLRASLGIPSLLHRVLASTWKWHGHVCRGSAGPAAFEPLQWRNVWWWRREQRNSQGLRHPRSGWPRTADYWMERWECMAKQGAWPWLAQDRRGWTKATGAFIKMANDELKGPRLPDEWRSGRAWQEALRETRPWEQPADDAADSSDGESLEAEAS